MQMFFELFFEGLILLVAIYFFLKYDMTILALPFIFIRSLFNDDKKDNYFLEQVGRFTKVEEDEPILHPLWNEI